MSTFMTERNELPILLKSVLSSLGLGIAIFDPDRKLIFVNPAMADVTGASDKSVGGSLAKLSERHRLRTKTGKMLEPQDFPIMRAFDGEEVREEPYLYISPEGLHVWLSVSCLRVLDDAGALLYVFCTISDITERKSKDDKLRFMVESEKILSITADFRKRLTEKARLTVPSLADWCAIDVLKGSTTERIAVVHSDPNMVRQLLNFQEKYPTDPKDPLSIYGLIKKSESRFIPIVTDAMLESVARSPEQLNDLRALKLRSFISVPITARGKGLGALSLAYAESSRTYTEEDLQFFQEFSAHLGILLDNAQLYEEIKGRDEAKDAFLASLSHELRNPLAPIKSSIELMKAADVPDSIREELELIEYQFDHMAKLLNDLLDVTRFTHAKITLSPMKTDLRQALKRALKASEPLVRNADITLHETPYGAPLYALVDEMRLEQAVSNIMSNAIKFTPAGGSIWVDLERSGAEARIRIRDNGAGIDAADMPNIFNMYYQGGHTRDQGATGLGIGLLLVQRIVHLHGGSVTAKSEGRGKGSEFTIMIPLMSGDTIPDTPPDSGGRERLSGKRILIVDDNIQAADSLAKLLNKVGARAEAQYSAEETLMHDLSPYHVLFVDVGMPRVDGYQLVRELRTRGMETPIVALTGYGMDDDKKRALEAGFTAHLTKPIGLKELSETIGQIA